MSKMGQYVFEMQEDAIEMTRKDFIEKYGESNAYVYDEAYDIFVCDDGDY